MNDITTEQPNRWATVTPWATVIALFATALLLFSSVTVPDRTLLFAALIAASVVGLALWLRPQWTTLMVIFLVYTNLPVVFVKFHGAPGILPALVIALLLWPLAHTLLIQKKPVVLSTAFPWILGFAIVQLIGSIFSEYPVQSFEFFVSFLTEGFLVYLILTNLIRDRRTMKNVFWMLALAGILMGGVPLFQQLSGNFDSEMGGLAQADSEFQTSESAVSGVNRQKRFAGTIGEKNRYAQFLIILLPIGICLFSISDSRVKKKIALAAILCTAFGFSLAFSRGAAIGFVFAVGVGVAVGQIPVRQLKWLAVIAVLVLAALPQYVTRLASISSLVGDSPSNVRLSNTDGSIRGRLTEMGAAALVFRDHLMIGVGPGVFREYAKEYGQRIGLRSLGGPRQAHCMPLDVAAETGILGLVTFTAMLWIILRRLFTAFRSAEDRGDEEGRHAATGLSLSMILYLTTSLFLHLSYIRYFWFLVALCDSGANVLERPDESTESNARRTCL